MAVSALARFAATAPVPVYTAVGECSREALEYLSLYEQIRFERSPRHASVLLVSGSFRDTDQIALRRLHDQLPHPRATLCWGSTGDFQMPQAEFLDASEDPLDALQTMYRCLLDGSRSSDDDLCADQPPQPWEGRGDHGQGGEGMMGGVPYGRPMAMPDDDLRDGLQLDACTVQLGPFIPGWPPGLVLKLTFQGDVVQHAQVLHAPYPPASAAPSASQRLRDVARFLFLLELAPQAEKIVRLAHRNERLAPADFAGLEGRLRRWGVFAAIGHDLGYLDAGDAQAVGLECDRNGYSNAEVRLQQWIEGAREMAAGEGRQLSPGTAVDSGRSQSPVPQLTGLLAGLEWHEARLVLASFDDMTLQRLASDEHGGHTQSPDEGGAAE